MAAYFTTMSVTSPHRPSHQLQRSITEQSPPIKQSRVHQYLHRRDRDREDRLSMSAGPHMRGSLDFPRAGPVTPGGTTDIGTRSRIGDIIPNADDLGVKSQRTLDDDEAARESKKNAAAATALKISLVELNAISNATIARLNETYSSVLQRLCSLQSTIMAMKELVARSQDIHENFGNESRALVSEVESQLSLYDQSTDQSMNQKKRIHDLQARIHAGRDKVNALSERVDVVRERIEGWEKADKDWQERTRKRLKATWIVISVVLLLLMFLFLGAQYAPSSLDIAKPAGPVSGMRNGRPPMESLLLNDSKSAAAMADEVREALAQGRSDSATEPEVLRVLDEL